MSERERPDRPDPSQEPPGRGEKWYRPEDPGLAERLRELEEGLEKEIKKTEKEQSDQPQQDQ